MVVRSVLNRFIQQKSSLKRAVFGHHKCASTWLINVVGMAAESIGVNVTYFHAPEQFGNDLNNAFNEVGDGIVVWANADYSLIEGHDVNAIHIVRDPRDVIVSGYFSHRNSHPTEGWPTLMAHRQALQAASEDEGILLEMSWPETILNIRRMKNWDYSNSNILELKYEYLLKDDSLFLECFSMLQLYEDGLTEQLGRRAIEANRFEKKAKGRKRGEEDVSSHFRKGKAGDWKNHFTPEQTAAYKRVAGDWFERHGYD